MGRQLPLQLLLLLLLCLLLLFHTHTYIFSQPITASVFLEGDFLPQDEGIILGIFPDETPEDPFAKKGKNNLFDSIGENCLSSCLSQLQPKNSASSTMKHQCGERSGARGNNQRWSQPPSISPDWWSLEIVILGQILSCPGWWPPPSGEICRPATIVGSSTTSTWLRLP